MELRHLRYFVAVAEAENVSRAALKLHVSQPGLSRQIRDLEAELGFPLLLRTAKSVSLTNAGRVFLIESRAVLQRAQDAVKAARIISDGGRTQLNVGYAPNPTSRIVPGTLRAFQTAMPKVRVKLHDMSTEEMLDGLRSGKMQIAMFVKPTKGMLRGIAFEELMRDKLCVVVPRDHAFAKLKTISLAKVVNEPFVTLTKKDYPEVQEFMEELFAHSKKKPIIAEEHDSSSSLVSAVEAGCGLAMMPQSLACTYGVRLKFIPLSPAPEPLVVGAAWMKSSVDSATLKFLECARKVAGALD